MFAASTTPRANHVRARSILVGWLVLPATLVAQATQTVARVNVTPSPARVVAGQSLQLKAEALDKDGKPVPGVLIRFQQANAPFEGTVDSTGLVLAGSVATIPVVVAAIQPGAKPVITQLDVKIIPGPAATISVSPASVKLVPKQTVVANARVFSKAGDTRNDAVAWTTSAPAVATVDRSGVITAVGAGSATITATGGAATQTVAVNVVGTPLASVSVTPSTPHARTGDVIKFKAVAKDAAGKEIAGLTPSWTFSPGKGEIDADGSFGGYEGGNYTVTALLGPNVAQTNVTLAARDVRRPATLVGSVVRSALATSEVWVHPNGKVAYLGTILGGDRVYVIDVSGPSNPAIVD